MTKTQNVFIVGTAYSGSTVLGYALNCHKNIAYAGEMNRLEKFTQMYKTAKIGGCLYCNMHDKPCPLFSKENIRKIELAGVEGYFSKFREITGKEIIIDGSKFLNWMRTVYYSNAFAKNKTKAIISVKNPFSFVQSFVSREIGLVFEGANMWRDTYLDAFRTLNSAGIPYMVVRYENYAFKPQDSLEKVCAFLDVEFDKTMLDFEKKEVHAIGGNLHALTWQDNFRIPPITMEKKIFSKEKAEKFKSDHKKFGGWVDDEWKFTLKKEDIQTILSMPMLSETMNLLGYKIYDLLEEYQKENIGFGDIKL